MEVFQELSAEGNKKDGNIIPAWNLDIIMMNRDIRRPGDNIFKRKWALITGASRGIGYLIAKYMASQGCNLILHSRGLEHNVKVMEEVKVFGVEAYSIAANLANHQEVVAMLDEIEDRGTAVDIIFNNAAVHVGYRTGYWKTPVEDFDLSFRSNLVAVTTIWIIPGRGRGKSQNVRVEAGQGDPETNRLPDLWSGGTAQQ